MFLEVFKERLDVALSAVVSFYMVLGHGLDSMISQVFSNLIDFVIMDSP